MPVGNWTSEQKNTLVALRDAGWDWKAISPKVNHSPRACACLYHAIKRKQSHLRLAVDNRDAKQPDYSKHEVKLK